MPSPNSFSYHVHDCRCCEAEITIPGEHSDGRCSETDLYYCLWCQDNCEPGGHTPPRERNRV